MHTQRRIRSLACLALALIPLSQAGADTQWPDRDGRRLDAPTPPAPSEPQGHPTQSPPARNLPSVDFAFSPEAIVNPAPDAALEGPATGRGVYYGVLCGVFLLGILHFARQIPVPPKPEASRRAEGLCGTG